MRHDRGSDRLIVLLAAYAVAYFALMRLPDDIIRSPIAGSDLSSYYTAGYLVRTGQGAHIYDVAPGDDILGDATAGPYRAAGDVVGIARQHYYIYPPFFALLASPLSGVSFAAARRLWMLTDFLLLGVSVAAFAAWRRRDGTSIGAIEAGLIAVTLGLEFLPLIWALAIGQTSVLLLALLCGTMLLVKKENEAAAGLLLGLATAIKLTPALLAVYFGLRGRKRTAIVAGAVFAAANLVAIAAMGAGPTLRFYGEVAPMMSGGTAYFLNQSIAGTIDRMLTNADVRQVALEPSSLARSVSLLIGLALLGVTAWCLARAGSRDGRRPEGMALDLEFSAVLLLTLMLSPISWSHHYLLAVIPLYTVAGAAARSGRASLVLASALGVAFLLIARKPHAELFTAGASRLALSAATLGALMLWGGCLVVRCWLAAPGTAGSEVARAS